MRENLKQSERVHISFFGKTNVGKSSLINVIANQSISIVSDVKGTTTDPVIKSIEILPLGPCVLIDTAGYDDDSAIGKLRVKKSLEILDRTDIAVLVFDTTSELELSDINFYEKLKSKKIYTIVVINKSDCLQNFNQLKIDIERKLSITPIPISSKTGFGVDDLKTAIKGSAIDRENKFSLIEDLISKDDIILLVTPIDESAPKGRLILPQVQMIRAILDSFGIAITVKETQLKEALIALNKKPKLVVCDSQVFKFVNEIVPKDIFLTSFSVLFARYKGSLDKFVEGVEFLKNLKDSDNILISEGCSHHRECGDIGSVKIPAMLEKILKKNFNYQFSSGHSFPENLKNFKIVIHCGGCLLTRKEVLNRLEYVEKEGIPIINYGILIAFLNGIYDRALEIFKR